MIRAADAAATTIVAGGLLVGVVAAATGRWRAGLVAALDLWVAAGLLRLGFAPRFDRSAAAAAVIAVRKLVMAGLRSSPVWASRRQR